MRYHVQVLVLGIGLIMPMLSTAEAIRETTAEVVKDVQNPITDRTSVPILNSTSFRAGPHDRTSNATLIQPLLPLSLGGNYIVVHPIVPLVYRPDLRQSSGGEFGFGDMTMQIYYVPAPSEHFTWGIGPAFLFPTASEEILGSEKWGMGPAIAAIWATDQWTLGGRANAYGSIAGDDAQEDVDVLTLQPLCTYSLGKGWYVASGPVITANFSQPEDQRWIVPIGGGLGRVMPLGKKQHLNISVQSYWHAVHSDGAGDWSLVVQFQSLFPRLHLP